MLLFHDNAAVGYNIYIYHTNIFILLYNNWFQLIREHVRDRSVNVCMLQCTSKHDFSLLSNTGFIKTWHGFVLLINGISSCNQEHLGCLLSFSEYVINIAAFPNSSF